MPRTPHSKEFVVKRLVLFLVASVWVITAIAPCSEALARNVKRSAKSSKNHRKPPKYRKRYSRGKPGKLTAEQKKRKKERDKKSKKTSVGRLLVKKTHVKTTKEGKKKVGSGGQVHDPFK